MTTADDRGATVPEAHIDAVALAFHTSWCSPLCVAPIRHSFTFRDEAKAVLVSTDPAALDALAWAVTRTPEGRDKVLAALVETGTLTDRWRWHQRGATGPERPVRRWVNEASGDTIEHRLVTEWTEVEP